MNIVERIHNLKDEEIDSFINNRLSEIKNTEKKVIGLNSNTYIYNGILDENVRVNILSAIKDTKSKVEFRYAGFKIDSNMLYKYLIAWCQRIDNPILAISYAVDDYLDLRNEKERNNNELYVSDSIRQKLYRLMAGKDITLSIGIIRKMYLAFCSEIAGVAHNMFRFMDIEADFVTGNKNNNGHSYNIIYPWGRDKNAIIFDACRSAECDPKFFCIDNNDKEKLFTGEYISVDDNNQIKAVKELFNTTYESTSNKVCKYNIYCPILSDDNKYDCIDYTSKYKLVFKKNFKEGR